jgi:Oxidoreductase NAD-binding domain
LPGGIGITPFFSICTQSARDKLPHQLYLFYSNRRPEDAPFLTALLDLAGQNPNFHFVATMTSMERSKMDWTGERRFIDGEMLKRHLPAFPGLKPGNLQEPSRGSKEPLFQQRPQAPFWLIAICYLPIALFFRYKRSARARSCEGRGPNNPASARIMCKEGF